MDRPAPLFQKRNSTRIVLKNRNRVTRPPVTTPPPTTTTEFIELPKVSRKTLRRKVTRNPIPTTQAPTAPPAPLKSYDQFSDVIDDDIAGVLPALTSAKPRKSLPVVETSTLTLPPQPFINFEPVQTIDPALNSFDKILEHQYKIKGLDISSEETYEDEKLIGVLGSQVCAS